MRKNYIKAGRITMFVLLLLYVIAMATATFIENSYGTAVAFKWFYHSPWFLLLELLLALNFLYLIFVGKIFAKRQWSGLMLHFAFVVILLGAAVTHFFSYEGILHIREGDKSGYMYMNNGKETKQLPFEVYLKDFRLERYPGSHSPSSYESDIVIYVDGKKEEHKIYMNNVVDVKGYRLFQSSYDKDEKGTVLTVNYDRAGMLITYTGYLLLLCGIVLTFFNRNSRLRVLISELGKLHSKTLNSAVAGLLLAVFTFVSTPAVAQENISSLPTVGKEQADNFGQLTVQNPKGRLEPVNTWTLKILRKIYQAEQFQGMSSDEVFLNLLVYPYEWSFVPFIKIKNEAIAGKLNKKGRYIAFQDMFGKNGDYLFKEEVEQIYNKNPNERSKYDTDLLKLDEVVNIIWQIQQGQMLALFPLENDANHTWYSVGDDLSVFQGKDSMFVSKIMTWYISELEDKNYVQANEVLKMISTYQSAKSGLEMNESKIRAEITYNKIGIFSKLFKYYLLFGGLLTLYLFVVLIQKQKRWRWIVYLLSSFIVILFLFHTFGLGLRWYISGYAPWTNSYESMVYVAWVIVLGGLLFAFRSKMILALSSVLGGIFLFVSSLNQMNPEITPLVPVLQSWWLMLHVSVIMAGYGFFFISALMGLFNMILMGIARGKEHIRKAIREMTILNEISMILGLMMMVAGTFIGAVWANESWGRYWGWDPKETWALISVIVYAIVLHIRMIPGLKSTYLFNLLAVLAVSSVLMTYFGVNYYLSGMHSYGKTDAGFLPWPFICGGCVIIAVAIWAGVADKCEKSRN